MICREAGGVLSWGCDSRPLSTESYGVALNVAQANTSSSTRIYGLEADVEKQEGSQLAF